MRQCHLLKNLYCLQFYHIFIHYRAEIRLPSFAKTFKFERLTTLNNNCTAILADIKPVKPSDYKIQMIASAPGSGKDWCRIAIGLLTGQLIN